MTLTQQSHFACLYDVRVGDLCTYYAPEGDPVTFEVTELRPTGTNAYVLIDTTLGPMQALAGTIVEVFDGFDLA